MRSLRDRSGPGCFPILGIGALWFLGGCSKPAPPEWQKLGLPLEPKNCEISEVNEGARSVFVICPGKAPEWQAKYQALTTTGWVEIGEKAGATHVIQKDGVAIDWTVEQHRDTDVSVLLHYRTGQR